MAIDSSSPAGGWDYIVIGAGSAGCVIATRLVKHGFKVLLLEAGPSDRNPMIYVPAGLTKLLRDPRYTWNFRTEPEAATGGRIFQWPRGKVLGGTGSINGLLHVRGNPSDYDSWAQMGCVGWSFADLLPIFLRCEDFPAGDPTIRGRGGPMHAEAYRTVLPLTHAFVNAAAEYGFVRNEDYNGRSQDGVAYSQQTRRGRFRQTTASAYLRPLGRHPNLAVRTEALATKLHFEGRRCVGVTYLRGGREESACAAREVIVCCSSIKSPHLLQCSGVGASDSLRQLGIDVVADIPGVGMNLIDHYAARVSHRVHGSLTVNELARGLRLAGEVARYVLTGRGALTFTVSTAMAFAKSRPGLDRPDLQIAFQPFTNDASRPGKLEREPGMSIAVVIARPDSRGTVMARSSNPLDPPEIRPNYLSMERDLALLVKGLRIARSIFAQPALALYSAGETAPSAAVASWSELADYARTTGIGFHHQVGGCAMGTDHNAVVDPRLRVRGLHGLRVADASIMPTITTGNTAIPVIAIGEKAADMIIEDSRA